MELNEAIENTMYQLCDFIRDGHLKLGSSASAGISQVMVNGKWYEVQIRLEGNEKHFIHEEGIIQSQVMGETITSS